MKFTEDDILKASPQQINTWVDSSIMFEKMKRSELFPNWTGNIGDAMQVEEKMNAAVLIWKYTSNVRRLILMDKGRCSDYDMMQASPEIRCKAALLSYLKFE